MEAYGISCFKFIFMSQVQAVILDYGIPCLNTAVVCCVGWSWLLSRKSLLKASKHLKEICGQCSLLYPGDVPCVLSACLVSLEPDSALRLMPDQFTPDERFSAASVSCPLATPHDVSCTHILVFPTSATTQSSQTAFQVGRLD